MSVAGCPRCAYIGTTCVSCEVDGLSSRVHEATMKAATSDVRVGLDMREDGNMVNLTVEVRLDDYRRLVKLADQRGESLGDYLRWVLTELT